MTGTLTANSASAADASQFKAGNIISDETFYNGNALSANVIQSFIASKEASCTASRGQPCLKDYRVSTPTIAATSFCATYNGRSNEPASDIIQRVGAACGISQEVLLVLLEKEQGLVSSIAPSAQQYRAATGYGCPDTADCDANYYGFFNQVYNAASQFQRYTQTSSTRGYQPGRYNNIQWHPNAACGSSSVYIENQATANLYIYTPYQPNSAALANYYGSGDGCSSYGNRNFSRIFNDWFGSPTEGRLKSASFEGGSSDGWGGSNGPINQLVAYGPQQAQHGNYFLATNTSVAGRAMTQDVARTTVVGEQVAATIWVRSASGRPYAGTMAVWGLGGSGNEQANKSFTATDQWQEIVVKLPIRKENRSKIRLDIYLQNTSDTLWIDNASMVFGAAPPVQNLAANPSFEGSFANWVPGNGFMNRQIYNDPALTQSGSWFAASNTPVAERSFSQTVSVPAGSTGKFVFSVWLRSSSDTVPFNGTVALWGLGAQSKPMNLTRFAVGNTWTKVDVEVDLGSSGSSALKAEVYMANTTDTLWLDNAVLAQNVLRASSFEGNVFAPWERSGSEVNTQVRSSSTALAAKDGSYFAATNTSTAGGSIRQDVQRQTTPGHTYTAEVWVRSEDGQPFNGVLALWALGGTTEATSLPFTAGAEWTRVMIELPIREENHTTLRLETYQSTTAGNLLVDATRVY
ncbi:hypothetical protein E3O45_12700 [Cryobacterium sp. TMS1-20-1]|uniref:carbohydrate binding domain-containing protein n=1 Tax=Cryobacterium sp. TMS1-20-1 TaxID=1259223 RepID=UPI001069F5C8|nr:carbohydrate binding domain-containing protein [Cryobacterium sp. TMS1-20-1]TFC72404.1 hypothetical protein E3O45_12700 [Cryobacterium sp. TMS1-20-1]